jgi:NAD(P)H-hydrate epimerase
MDVLTKDLIKLSEENAVQSGTFSYLELMKIAGDKATEIILQKIDVSNKRVAVLCGTGNNGGDGFVVARNLQEKGADVTVITPLGKPTTDSAKHYYKMLDSVEITDNLMGEYDVIIDALFGIGLNRELSQQVIKILEEINSYGAYKISIDIPSGIECDTGKILGAYFKADLVITFIAQKPCFYLPTANEFAGEIVVANIGVRPCTKKLKTIEPPIFKERDKNSHKGTYGTATMFCGSFGMAGAAILSSRACIRSGVGIAKCVVPKSIYHILTTAVPEAVCVVSPQTLNGTLCGFININKALEKATATLIGCGMGNNWHTQKLVCRLLNTAKIPTVIDADGINALVSNINVLKKTNASVIITPHPAEMSRLTGKTVKEIEQNRFKVAMDFAKKFNCYVVLKGANTIFATPDGQVFFNTCGNPGMATGGSGDVLAGIIVSFLAQGMDIIDAVKAAIYVHSNTADMVAKEIGEMALMPSDIIEAL